MTAADPDPDDRAPLPASPLQIAGVFGRISSTSFGGGQMAAMRREVVRSKRWLDDDQYLEILALAQLLPGSNPINVAVLIGQRLAGIAGAAAGLFAVVLPGFTILMIIGALALDSHEPWVRGALRGCAAMAVGLTLANVIELTAKRRTAVDIALIVSVAAVVALLHLSLVLTLAIFIPVALVMTRPRTKTS